MSHNRAEFPTDPVKIQEMRNELKSIKKTHPYHLALCMDFYIKFGFEDVIPPIMLERRQRLWITDDDVDLWYETEEFIMEVLEKRPERLFSGCNNRYIAIILERVRTEENLYKIIMHPALNHIIEEKWITTDKYEYWMSNSNCTHLVFFLSKIPYLTNHTFFHMLKDSRKRLEISPKIMSEFDNLIKFPVKIQGIGSKKIFMPKKIHIPSNMNRLGRLMTMLVYKVINEKCNCYYKYGDTHKFDSYHYKERNPDEVVPNKLLTFAAEPPTND